MPPRRPFLVRRGSGSIKGAYRLDTDFVDDKSSVGRPIIPRFVTLDTDFVADKSSVGRAIIPRFVTLNTDFVADKSSWDGYGDRRRPFQINTDQM